MRLLLVYLQGRSDPRTGENVQWEERKRQKEWHKEERGEKKKEKERKMRRVSHANPDFPLTDLNLEGLGTIRCRADDGARLDVDLHGVSWTGDTKTAINDLDDGRLVQRKALMGTLVGDGKDVITAFLAQEKQ